MQSDPSEHKVEAPHSPVPSTLFTQIFALVLLAVATAQLLNVLILTVVPPKPPRTIPLGAVAEAIVERNEDLLQFTKTTYTPSQPTTDAPAISRIEDDLANRLGLDSNAVVVRLTDMNGRRFVQLYPRDSSTAPEPALIGLFQIYIFDGQSWTTIEPRDRGPFDSRERQFLFLFLVSAALMLPVAWLFARRLSRPIETFADAAEQIGRDPRALPPQINGPEEIERAAEAIRLMQQRLQAYVTDRTQMLGAIAHDLRTPLTRLAFRLENIEDPERDRMREDIREMDAMIRATLSMARADTQTSPHQRLELGSLVEQVGDDLAETGRNITVSCNQSLVIAGDPLDLRRLFANLMENAETYGKSAHATVYQHGSMAFVDIDDQGPGLPSAELEKVFDPFYRVERSRNRETGGTGLGLTVVRSIARSHGGDVILENLPEGQGGLRARVMLPLVPAKKDA